MSRIPKMSDFHIGQRLVIYYSQNPYLTRFKTGVKGAKKLGFDLEESALQRIGRVVGLYPKFVVLEFASLMTGAKYRESWNYRNLWHALNKKPVPDSYIDGLSPAAKSAREGGWHSQQPGR